MTVFYLRYNPQFRPVYKNYTEQILIVNLELLTYILRSFRSLRTAASVWGEVIGLVRPM